MRLDPYIADLLQRYDCVIVPDFGGFVANYQAAKINSTTNIFSPPGKQLSFNRNLKGNDGLLANHIIQEYGVSYNEALNAISNCVDEYNRELKSGKRVLIEKVGILYLDENKNVLFEPISTFNFLSDSFGLEKFHVLPKNIEKEEKKVKKTKLISIHPGRVAAAIAIPLFFIGSALVFQKSEATNYSQIQLSNLGFSMATPTYDIRDKVEFIDEDESVEASFELLLEKANKKNDFNEADEPSIENWFVVGGCFSEKSNASSFIKKLKRKGYPAKEIDQYKKLHAVAYKGFESESDARAFLAKVKHDENASAWLLKRK